MAQKLQKLNMGNILKRIGYITGQSRKITYYRPPIYGRDDYGVETGAVDTNEILVPNVQAYMRNQVEKDYVLQRGGHNIIGMSRVYLPNLATLKNFPNFNQNNNILFNEIEGFDKLIDVDRVVYTVVTSSSTDWSVSEGASSGSVTSDGDEMVTYTINTAVGPITPTYDISGDSQNTLESNRLTFQVKASGAVTLHNMKTYNGGSTAAYGTTFDNTTLTVPTGSWLTVDYPFASGTLTHPASTSSVYLGGTRYAVDITSGSTFDYEGNLNLFSLNVSSSASGSQLYIRAVKYYKGIEWIVHSINDYNDEYMVFDCVRTAGKRESRRRAY